MRNNIKINELFKSKQQPRFFEYKHITLLCMQRCINIHKQVHVHAIIYSHVTQKWSGFTVRHRCGRLNII